MWIKNLIIVMVLIIAIFPLSLDREEKFTQFISKIEKEARKSGVSENTIHHYLKKVTIPKPRVIKTESHKLPLQGQQEFSFDQYLKNLTSPQKLNDGIAAYQKNLPLLKKIEARYHVQPQIIVALWGIETDYGRNMGHFNIVETLLNLAYQHHRTDYYKQQLIAALKMLDAPKVIPPQIISTWDGGMGHPSFEPTSYFDYAVDFDGDGFKDIWTSVPDGLASIANFLHSLGWKDDQPWGMEVKVPTDIPLNLVNQLKEKLPIDQWQKMGVRTLDGKDLPLVDSTAALILPSGINGRAFLVFHNFNILMIWNNTYFEGISVGILSDEIVAKANKSSAF